jgi:DNA-binding CsgD family transcriptional regulator
VIDLVGKRDRIPKALLVELSQYVGGELIYVPKNPERRTRQFSSDEREQRDREIVRRFARGQSKTQISRELGLSARRVRQIVAAVGPEVESEHRASRAMIKHIRELRRRGKSWRQIGEILGISYEKARALIR